MCCCNRKQAQNRLENPTELQDVKTTFFSHRQSFEIQCSPPKKFGRKMY